MYLSWKTVAPAPCVPASAVAAPLSACARRKYLIFPFLICHFTGGEQGGQPSHSKKKKKGSKSRNSPNKYHLTLEEPQSFWSITLFSEWELRVRFLSIAAIFYPKRSRITSHAQSSPHASALHPSAPIRAPLIFAGVSVVQSEPHVCQDSGRSAREERGKSARGNTIFRLRVEEQSHSPK